jgi:hypothetical protein
MALLDFSIIKKALQSVESRLDDLRNERLDLQKQREALRYAPQTREAVLSMLAQWQKDVLSPDTHSQIVAAIATFARTARAGSNGAPLKDLLTSPTTTTALLHAAMAQQLRKELENLVAAVTWPDGAVSDSERKQRMAVLDRRIGELTAEEDQILSSARSAGLNLE